MSITKPTVHYIQHEGDYLGKGVPALLNDVIDHPSEMVSNTPGVAVRTSPVEKIDLLMGYFETENTVFCPVRQDVGDRMREEYKKNKSEVFKLRQDS